MSLGDGVAEYAGKRLGESSPYWQATLRRDEAGVDRGVSPPAVEAGFDEHDYDNQASGGQWCRC